MHLRGAGLSVGVHLVENGTGRDLGEGHLEVFLEIVREVVSKSGLEDELEGELEVGNLFAVLTVLAEVRETHVSDERSALHEFLG